jgi:CHAT domain-containing protein/Flp pilus assembly protein TadD
VRVRIAALLLAVAFACAAHAAAPGSGRGTGQLYRGLWAQTNEAIAAGDYALAEELARKRLSLAGFVPPEKRGAAYVKLGAVLRLRGKYADAEAVLRQGLGIAEEARGRDSEQAVRMLANLGAIYILQSRYAEARTALRESLARAGKPGSSAGAGDLVRARDGLARVALSLGDYAEAEAELAAAQAAGDDHKGMTDRLLAEANLMQGRDEEVERRTRVAVRRIADGEVHGLPAVEWYLLRGLALDRLGRRDAAQQAYRNALDLAEASLGAAHPATARALGGLAGLAEKEGRLSDAETLLARATAPGRDSGASEQQAKLEWAHARLLARVDRPGEALAQYRAAADRVDRIFAQTQGFEEATREAYAAGFLPLYYEFLELLLRQHAAQPGAGHDREALAVVSRTQSRVFSEMLRRADAGRLLAEPGFNELRGRQAALQARVLALRRARVEAGGEEDGDEGGDDEGAPRRGSQDPLIRARIAAARAESVRELAAAEAELAKADAALWEKYPRYMELAQPRPVTAELLQGRLLGEGETLVTYFLLPRRTLAFVVTRSGFRLLELPRGRAEVAALVAKARAYERAPGDLLRNLAQLDPGALNELYLDLFAPLLEAIGPARRLLVVGDGPIHTLPLEMLVTRWGDAERKAFADARAAQEPYLGEYATLPYLGRSYRFSYLPSLAALSSVRLYRKAQGRVDNELVSFADPVFAGRSLAPLPETAEEARRIAQIVGGRTEVFLGERAQEHTLKALDLRNTRYLHFATHGLLGTELAELKRATGGEAKAIELAWNTAGAGAAAQPQPALALTLKGNLAGEDGLLTMGEVVGSLDLNARVVVLSACNTAGEGAGANGGEGFAGLTRAFMYAGAHALLASQWEVESESTRDLMVAFFEALRAGDDGILALQKARESVSGTLLKGRISRAHPYFWAPFVYIGE